MHIDAALTLILSMVMYIDAAPTKILSTVMYTEGKKFSN